MIAAFIRSATKGTFMAKTQDDLTRIQTKLAAAEAALPDLEKALRDTALDASLTDDFTEHETGGCREPC
jgi:hypothetical protein